jgi:hypothetical protein
LEKVSNNLFYSGAYPVVNVQYGAGRFAEGREAPARWSASAFAVQVPYLADFFFLMLPMNIAAIAEKMIAPMIFKAEAVSPS